MVGKGEGDEIEERRGLGMEKEMGAGTMHVDGKKRR